ncbi:MAG: sigma factor-like helix-turn-helix DNA-binding protein [Clostridium sp.]|nr:sigma factor-like helix-turn-helix DNA-binding protein [Clostridium sp.]MDU7339118.1 sigma factor-like helix-turn-helix DNA-binding protein [Clostridium sp.]
MTEIASILKISDNAVKAALYRGRKKLKIQLEEVAVNE